MHIYFNCNFFQFVFFNLSFSIVKQRNLLQQVWVYEKYDDGILTYVSEKKFSKLKPGIEFRDNGLLKVKQNSSWCGTDPIDYEIIEGKWNQLNDSIINLEYKFWSGNTLQARQIIELTKNKLRLKVIEIK